MDILAQGTETQETLVIGKSVALIATRKELNNTASLIALAQISERELLEGPVDGILFYDTKGKDHLHYRRGTLDETAAKILAQDKKALVIPVLSLLTDARALGRALQDARLATTHGADVVFVSLGEEYVPTTHDLEATVRALGFHEEVVAKNQKTLAAWVARARHRASDDYIAEGISQAKGI